MSLIKKETKQTIEWLDRTLLGNDELIVIYNEIIETKYKFFGMTVRHNVVSSRHGGKWNISDLANSTKIGFS